MKSLKVFIKQGTRCPLTDKPQLAAEYGLELVPEPEQADWIITARVKALAPYILKYPGKRYLVYTNEPRYSRLTCKQLRSLPLLPKIEIMNVFTGDVFWHNFHFLGSYHFDLENTLDINLHQPLLPLSSKDFVSTDKRLVAAMYTYRVTDNTTYVVHGTNRDLEQTRCSFAKALHQAGLCDIYGGNWPAGVSKEDSGYTALPEAPVPWWTRKLTLLSGYRYNLCLENTVADYYCTEKIWHAIQAGTLPIYWGAKSTIYEIFPKNSFIDLADFNNPQSLVDYLQTLSEEEYFHRNNTCREVFNRCITERKKTIAEDAKLHMDGIMNRLRP